MSARYWADRFQDGAHLLPLNSRRRRLLQYESRIEGFFLDAEVLITGGFGFIGSHLAGRLVELGARVTLIDLDTSPDRPSLINLRPELRESVFAIRCNLADSIGVVRDVIQAKPFKSVFNCASFASVVERAVDFPYETVQTNTIGLLNLLESIRTDERRPVSIVHTSTDKVYGDSGGEPYDEERSPLLATGVYDVSKLAADTFARMYHRVYGVPTVVVRLCNIFGPYDFNTSYRVVPKAMKSLLAGARPEPPNLYASSVHHERDYLYIDDCVRALLEVAAAPQCLGKVYNLKGCKHLKTPAMIRAVLRAVAEIERWTDTARATEIEENGYIVVAEPTPGVVTIPTQSASGRRLRADVGFEPRTSLKEGLLLTAEGYRDYFVRRRLFQPVGIASGEALAREVG
jgi:nucleoside-diphosphate-sugar epimerase